MIQNLIAQKPLPVYGKGENIRDWLYVKDHVQAIDLILHQGKLGETYAIGGNNEKQNIELVRLLIALLDKKLNRPEGASLSLLTFVTDRLGHDYRYAIDTTKIERELGWKPTTSFKEGMEKTVDFYLQN
jgi:dTDP-glucose 4,6-dehydratase